MNILSFVGKSDSGKTSVLEKIIAELKKRGYKIAVIKHTQDFELDREGTSSWRLGQAGSDAIILSSPGQIASIQKTEHDLSPKELLPFVNGNFDLILTEGFKTAANKKVELHRKEQGEGLLCPPEQLLAVVTDERLNVDVPQFSHDDAKSLADLIETWMRKTEPENEVQLFINKETISLNPFVKGMFMQTLMGMVSSLKGVKDIKELRLFIRRKS